MASLFRASISIIRISSFGFLTLAIISTFATNAYAEDSNQTTPSSGLTLQPVISQSGVWDSNPLLATSNVKSLYGSVTSPEFILSDFTPTEDIVLDETIAENIFNQSNFNSTDIHSKNKIETHNQLWNTSLAGGYDYDTTRNSEPTVYGFQSQTVRHTGFNVTPEVIYSFLPTDKIGITGTVVTSHYAASSFTDYNQFSATPSYTHNFDPLNAGLINFTAQRYQATQGLESISDTLSPSVGWLRTITPELSARATLGGQVMRSYQANTETKPWQLDYVFSGDVTFKGEQDKTNLAVARAAVPFGNGTESLLTSITLKDDHSLNTEFSLNFGGNYEYASYQTNSTNNLQSLASVNGGLTYHLTKNVDITGSYQYRYETLVNVNKSPDDHTVNFQISYRPDVWNF